MKKNDRETKKWLDEEVVDAKVSKRKLCKGGREHDWMLCLPWYVAVKDSALGLDKVEEYYRIEDEREDCEIAFEERLEEIGISNRRRGRARYNALLLTLVDAVNELNGHTPEQTLEEKFDDYCDEILSWNTKDLAQIAAKHYKDKQD